MRLTVLFVLLFAGGVSSISLDQFFPYGNATPYSYSPWSTSSSIGISSWIPFPFFGRNYYILWRSGAGFFNFGSWQFWNFLSVNPGRFPLNNTAPVIAGFWTSISHPTNTICGNQVCNQIYTGFDYFYTDNRTRSMITTYLQRYMPQERSFFPSQFFTATYLRITPSANFTNLTNTFQIMYTTDGRRSFVFLLFNELRWSQTPNSSHALVGLNAGNGVTHVNLPYSATQNVTYLVNESNVGLSGLFIYRVDQISISERCSANYPLNLYPYFGSLLGSTPIFIQGPCFTNMTSSMLRCRFGSIAVVNAVIINDVEAMCLSPPTATPGPVVVDFSVDAGSTFTRITQIFYYFPLNIGINVLSSGEVSVVNRLDSIISPGEQISLSWYYSPWTRSKWPENRTMCLQIQMTPIQLNTSNNGLSLSSFRTLQTGIVSTNNYQSTSIIVPSISNATEAIVFRILVQDNSTGIVYGALHSAIFILNVSASAAAHYCRSWMSREPLPTTWNQNLLDCPMTLTQARAARCCYGQDWSCYEFGSSTTGNCAFRRGRPTEQEASAAACFQSWNTNQFGARSECCYDSGGQLITRGRGAGTDDRHHVFRQPIQYFFGDLMPFLACCHLNSENDTCDGYLNLRPPRRGTNTAFTWGGGWGDPHYVTLDGSSYTFNGYGEYTYLAIENISSTTSAFNPSNQSFLFMSQVRTTPRVLSNGTISGQATFTRGFAAKSNHPQAERISLIISNLQSTIIHRGNDTIDFDAGSEDTVQQSIIQSFSYPEMMIERNRSSNVIQLTWYIGITIIITPISITAPELTTLLNIGISIDESMKNRTFGLLGPYDGVTSNDMRAANGTVIGLADNLPLDVVHRQFGQSWAIDPSQSLFFYETDDSANFYAAQNANFTPLFGPALLTASEDARLRVACNISASVNQSMWTVAERTCYYDISVTNDTSFGRNSLSAANTVADNVVAQRNPPLFDPYLPVLVTANFSDYLTLNITATSDVGAPIIYNLTRGPSGALFNNQTGRFEWQIPGSAVTDTLIQVSAEDSQYHLRSIHEVLVRLPRSSSSSETNSGASTFSIEKQYHSYKLLCTGLFIIASMTEIIFNST